MSNHNLFIHGVDGAAKPATAEQILAAARQVLSHRVRRGATLSSPQKVREYLSMRLGHLDYEVFGLILVDSHHRVIEYVELFRGTIDGASVHPREVVKLILDREAAAWLLVHNHPSQVGEFSHADECRWRSDIPQNGRSNFPHLERTGTMASASMNGCFRRRCAQRGRVIRDS